MNKQIADTSFLDIDNDIKLKGEYKIGDVIFNKIIIKIKTHVVRQHDNDLPKVYSMSFRNKSEFNADLFRIFIYRVYPAFNISQDYVSNKKFIYFSELPMF